MGIGIVEEMRAAATDGCVQIGVAVGAVSFKVDMFLAVAAYRCFGGVGTVNAVVVVEVHGLIRATVAG